jgi:hypothetical protein
MQSFPTRLKHTSLNAFRRSMQISNADLFVFVEGKSDRFFYNKVCLEALRGRGLTYQIRLAQELPGQTGGKAELLRCFSYLRQRNALLEDFKGRRFATVFFLDKDIEDLARTTKNSIHLIYTQHYHLENYFFIHGDLIEATAVASTLNHDDVRRSPIGNNLTWREQAADNWRDWVKLCVFTVLRRINYDSSFSVLSRINNGPYSTVNQNEYQRRLRELETRSGLTSRGFARAFRRISQHVDDLYNDREFDKVFKGQWYSYFLVEDSRRIAAGRPMDSASLPDKLILALQLTLNFQDPWAEHFRRPVEQIAEAITTR